MRKFNSSTYKLLKETYPEFEWRPWRFSRIPREAATDPEVLAMAVKHLAASHGVKNPEDWYRLSIEQIRTSEVAKIIELQGGLERGLKVCFPDVAWESNYIADSKS